jgi:hypothetical protein
MPPKKAPKTIDAKVEEPATAQRVRTVTVNYGEVQRDSRLALDAVEYADAIRAGKTPPATIDSLRELLEHAHRMANRGASYGTMSAATRGSLTHQGNMRIITFGSGPKYQWYADLGRARILFRTFAELADQYDAPWATDAARTARDAAKCLPDPLIIEKAEREFCEPPMVEHILKCWRDGKQYSTISAEVAELIATLRAYIPGAHMLPEETITFAQVVGRFKSEKGYGDSKLRIIKNRIQRAMVAGLLVSSDRGKTFTAESVEDFIATQPNKREVRKRG